MEFTFAQNDPSIIALILALTMLAAWAWGWYIGRRHPADPDDKSAGRFVDGSLALLGLLLGFTFAMALGKHEQRRAMVINDANSIGDFYTTAAFLPDAHREPLQAVISQYLNIRLTLARSRPDPSASAQAILDSEKLQQHMTTITKAAINDSTPVVVPLVNTLNNLISSQTSLIAAMHDRLPLAVLLLLASAAVVSTLLVGRHHGARNRLHLAGSICYVLLICLAVYVILDLNQPSRGLIEVSIEPYERLEASIAK